MKKILLIVSIITTALSVAQTELIAYPAAGKGVASTFVTDYHALGINPANLGWKAYKDKSFTTGTTEFGFSIYSSALSSQDLRDNLAAIVRNKSLNALTKAEKIKAVQDFSNSDFAFNFDNNIFGFSYQNDVFGGIAISIRTRASWSSKFSSTFTDLLFNGNQAAYFDSLQIVTGLDTTIVANNNTLDTNALVLNGQASIPLNISNLLDGTDLKLSWNREYHIGYGRKLLDLDSNLVLYGGVGVKYIQGIAYFDLESKNGNIRMTSALSPGFNIDYGFAALSNPSALAQNAQSFLKSSVGNGWGFDIGVNALLLKKIHIAVSVTDIGSMTYNGNVYEVEDTLVVGLSTAGLTDMNITNAVPSLLEDNGLLKLKGKESFTVTLPGTLRLGGSIELGKVAHVGIDLVAPFNNVPGSFNAFSWGVGGDVKLFNGQIVLMTGVTGGGGHAIQMPVGINFAIKGGSYEFGIASRDAVTFFKENAPTLSAAMGFARVRF